MRLCVSALAVSLVVLAGCDSSQPAPGGVPEGLITGLSVALNPSGAAPLSAEITLGTSEAVSVAVEVAGRGGAGTEIGRALDGTSRSHRVPVLGLYPASTNRVVLTLTDASGRLLGTREVEVTTPALPSDFPVVRIDVAPGAASAPGVTLVSYFGHDSEIQPQRAFAFDQTGTIRWALDFTGHPTLGSLFFDDGIERLANGNLYFGDRSTDAVYELDMLGRIVRLWSMPGFSFHHHVLEKPNGNFLATVNRDGLATVEDHVIEIDRRSGEIVTVWDLRQSLDASRRAWPTNLADLDVDWFHGNGLAYDASDGTIVVSGRTQGVVKLTADNRVVWILAPHRQWGTAGDGTDLATRLLQPLDAQNRPIADAAVLDGAAAHPDFEWAWYQHAPKVLADGSLLLFDNGDNRSYGQGGTYSRAVQFQIDDQARTVRQVWAYGRERGAETYSRIVSDADDLPDSGTVVFAPGALAGGSGKMIELDRATRTVVYEATITPPTAPFGITFHRVERLSLYPDATPPALLAVR